MYLENDISEVVCPKCNKNNDNLEVLGCMFLHKVTLENICIYDIICSSCHKVFTSQVYLSID